MKNTTHITAGMLTLLMGLAAPLPALAGPGAPPGWSISGSRPGDYDFGTEHVEGAEGRQSAYIKAKPGAIPGGFGGLLQVVKADNYVGQRVRVSARLKSDAVDRLELWFRIDAADKERTVLRFKNMDDHPVTGTEDWKRYSIVFDVPSDSAFLYFGFFLQGGKGEGWADSFVVEKVNKDVPVSTNQFSPAHNSPTNLNFDQ